MTLEQAETHLKFAEQDMRGARTHQAAVHAMNRVAHWRRVVANLTHGA